MNDIHALLTSQDGPHGDEVPALVAEIAARTRRSLARAQVITAKVVQGAYGLPVALVDADGTAVSVGQQIGGAGVLIQVTTNNADEAGRLIVSVNGLVQRPAGRPGACRAQAPSPPHPHPSGDAKAAGT